MTIHQSTALAGVPAMILASLAFAIMAALVKATGDHLPAIELVFLRCVLSLPLMAILLLRSGDRFLPAQPKLLVWRSLFGLAAMTLSFYGLSRLDLGDQIMLSKTSPLWIAVLAPTLLGERADRQTLLVVALALGGSALVLRPSLAVGNLAGFAVLASAMSAAVAHILIRRLSAKDASLTIVFGFCAITGAMAAPAVWFLGAMPSPREWALVGGVALAATAGQLLMTHAYSVEEAPVVSAAGYVNVVFAMMLGFMFWGEIPTPWGAAGGSLIVASGLLLALGRQGRGRGTEQRRFIATERG